MEKYFSGNNSICSSNTSYPICLTAGVYVQQSTMICVHHPLHSTRSIGNSQTISVYNNHQAIENSRVPQHNCQSQKDGSEPVGFLFFVEFSPDSNLNNGGIILSQFSWFLKKTSSNFNTRKRE